MSKSSSKRRHDITTILSLWIFPACALFITGYLLYDFYSEQGPLIQIVFDEAAAVEPQRTLLRYRGVAVGRVENVTLTPDSQKVTVSARLTKDAKNLAVEGSRFWIIQPQVGFDGIRGLETIIKGPYIRVEVGKGAPARKFSGFIGDPELGASQIVKSFVLKTREVKSIDEGDAITYRGLRVGKVSKVELAEKGQGIDVHINIERRYAKLVREKTVFWVKTAVDAKIGLLGADIKINSLDTLMRGGIALAVPNVTGDIVPAKHVFAIQDTPPKDWISWSPEL